MTLTDRVQRRDVFDAPYCYEATVGAAHGPGYSGPGGTCNAVRLLDWEWQGDPAEPQVLTLRGRLDFGPSGPTNVVVEHEFRFFGEAPFIEEQLSIAVRGGQDFYQLEHVRFAARKTLFDRRSDTWTDGTLDSRLVAVPFRRRIGQSVDHRLEGYGASDLIPVGWHGTSLPDRSAEAWLWGGRDGGYLIAKNAPDHIEFAIVDGEQYRPPGAEASPDRPTHLPGISSGTNVCLRLAGAGVTRGSPRAALQLSSGDTFTFGTTRIEPYGESWERGYDAYKQYLASLGHGLPPGYEASVHWNELYSLSWRLGSNSPLPERSQLLHEAELATAIGATTLYLDPGWDLSEGSSIWDETRLGPFAAFASEVKRSYGLSLALHVMAHTKSLSEDPAIYRRCRDGSIDEWKGMYSGGYICAASPSWQELKAGRLCALAEAGATFFMLDFLSYEPGELGSGAPGARSAMSACWSSEHGHSVPCTFEEHSAGVIAVIGHLKRRHPGVIVECHDRIASGYMDYLPLYYQHGAATSFDEHWGFEFMWDPYMDLLSGKALSLYEYNLAYDIPLYLHINCAHDNTRSLAFWWYASTCRHLGIGGVQPGDPMWSPLALAMQTYSRLRRYFVLGRFVGIDELAHLHALGDGSAVVTVFNLGAGTRIAELSVATDRAGVSKLSSIVGGDASIEAGVLLMRVEVPALGVAVVELNVPSA